MNLQIQTHQNALIPFCQKWHVRALFLFGSALRNDFSPQSALDFLVSFHPGARLDLFDLVEMREKLERSLGRPVDLVEKEALRTPWPRYEILRTREVVYR